MAWKSYPLFPTNATYNNHNLVTCVSTLYALNFQLHQFQSKILLSLIAHRLQTLKKYNTKTKRNAHLLTLNSDYINQRDMLLTGRVKMILNC